MTLDEMRASTRRVLGVDVPLGPPTGEGPYVLRRLDRRQHATARTIPGPPSVPGRRRRPHIHLIARSLAVLGSVRSVVCRPARSLYVRYGLSADKNSSDSEKDTPSLAPARPRQPINTPTCRDDRFPTPRSPTGPRSNSGDGRRSDERYSLSNPNGSGAVPSAPLGSRKLNDCSRFGCASQ